MQYYIGMDAHSTTSVFVVIDSTGSEIVSQRVRTTEKEILNFICQFKGEIHLTFEESNISRWLYGLLNNKIEHLIVCNPSFVGRRSGSKTDYSDAAHLAQQLRGGLLSSVFHCNDELFELRGTVSAYQDVVRDLVRNKNRYKALFRSEGHTTLGRNFWKSGEQTNALKLESDRFIACSLLTQIESLNDIKTDYQDKFRANTKRIPEIKSLSSIPGVSSVRANTIASIVCSPSRFKNKYRFWSYCMLIKHDRQSDGRSYGRVSVNARSDLKNVFMGAAESALKGDSALKKEYEAMREKGLDHWAAKKNVARKIAAISLAVMKRKKPYLEDLTDPKTVVAKRI